MSTPFARVAGVVFGILLGAAVPAGVSAWLHPRAPAWTRNAGHAAGLIQWRDAAAMSGALWIDARSSEDFARGHVAGALSLPASEWDAQVEAVLAEWTPGRTVIVYCGGNDCHASEAAAQRLRDELGLGDVRVLAGGWHGERKDTP